MSFDKIDPLEDPRAMRALAHPVRLQIRDLLDDEGPLTATEVSDRIGESPANCSFHLRTLAKYGFIEEAEGGKGRNRPWQIRSGWMRVEPENLSGDARRAALVMGQALRAALARRIESWARRQHDLPEPWQHVGFQMQVDTNLSPEDLKQIGERIGEVLAPYTKHADSTPDTRRVTIAVQGFPHVNGDD